MNEAGVMVEVSETVSEFVDLLGAYAKDGLRERDNLGRLLQHAYNAGNTGIVGELAFHGKYLWKLYGTFRKEDAGSDRYEKLEQEFSRTVHEFHAKLALLVKNAPDDFKQMIEKHYLSVSEPALKHLLSLAHDFYWLKNWELEMAAREQDASGTPDASE